MKKLLTLSCFILFAGCSKTGIIKDKPKSAQYRYHGVLQLKTVWKGQEFEDSLYNINIFATENYKRNTIRIDWDTSYGPFTQTSAHTYHVSYRGDTVNVDINVSEEAISIKRLTKLTVDESRLEEFNSSVFAVSYEY